MYIEQFKNNADIIREYEAPADALDGAEVLLAWYGCGSYCGSSLVVYKKDGKLYEVNGNHCSCFALEGQWEPEETSVEALSKKSFGGYGEYDGEEEAQKALTNLIVSLQGNSNVQ